MGCFYPNYIRFELKNTEELSLMTLNSDANFEWTLTLWLQKWHKELGEFSIEHSQSEKLYIDGLFLSKSYNVSGRTFHRIYVSWQWRMIQILKENWLVARKMTLWIWLLFMRAVRSLKICTLMDLFYKDLYKDLN